MTMHFVCPSIHVPPKRWQSALVIGLSETEGVDVPTPLDGALPGVPLGVLGFLMSLPVAPPPVVLPPVIPPPVIPLPDGRGGAASWSGRVTRLESNMETPPGGSGVAVAIV